MVGSGECSQQRHRRIQKKKTSSSIAQPNKPKAKRGPKKKSKRKFNFQPKAPTTNAIANNPSVVTRARNAIATASVVVASHNRTSSAITDETVVKRPRRSRSPRASTRSTVSISEIHRTESKMYQYYTRQVLQFYINVNLPPISNHPTIIHQLSPRNNCKT